MSPVLAPTPVLPDAGPGDNEPGDNEPASSLQVLAVTINGQPIDDGVIVAFRGGQAFLPEAFARRARLAFDPAALVRLDGQPHLPLAAVDGHYRVDPAAQALIVTVPTGAFLPSRLSAAEDPLPLSRVRPAAYINYDAVLSRAAGTVLAGGVIEAGVTGAWGRLTSRWIAGHARPPVLLDTSLVRDDPALRWRLSLGDALTRGSSWSAPLRFTGVRLGTDFSLQPGFQTLPSPTIRGEAALPSTLAVYVNNALSAQTRVEQGPFLFDRAPIMTGAGRITLRATDLLGVTRTMVYPYYVSSRMLRPGLTDFSIEYGVERRDFGQASFAYGGLFAAGSYRRGMTPGLTLEAHGESSARILGGGIGLAATLGTVAEAGAAFALSHGTEGTGLLARLYAARQGPGWSLSATVQAGSPDYRQVGLGAPPRFQLQLGASATLPALGDLSLTAVRLRDRAASIQVGSLGLFRRLGLRTTVSAYALASRAETGAARVSLGLSLVRMLGGGLSGSLRSDSGQVGVDLQKPVPADRGWGFRVLATDLPHGSVQAEAGWQTPAFRATAAAARRGDATEARLLVEGGLLLAGGAVLPTRRVDGAVAIVDAAGHANIRIVQDNRIVGRTDRHGLAVVTGLRAFESNRIGLVAEDLDIATGLGSKQVEVVPAARAAVDVRFAISAGIPATLIIADPGGGLIAPGTAVRTGTGGATIVAGYGGTVFLDDARPGQVLQVERPDGGTCRVTVPPLPPHETLPEIGPLACEVPR